MILAERAERLQAEVVAASAQAEAASANAEAANAQADLSSTEAFISRLIPLPELIESASLR